MSRDVGHAVRDTRPRATAIGILLALGAIKVVVHVTTDGNIGYHQDELYYLDSARHPQLGYVDYPPLTPMVARLAGALFDGSVVGLRLFAALAGAAVVVLTGQIAAELGGGRRAQVLAGLAALTAPMLLDANWLFQTVSFDQLFWMGSLYVMARILRTGQPRLWLLLGALLGLGLETKYTVLALCAGIAVATVTARRLRAMLLTPYPWLGALVAAALWAPNVWWQAANGWPTLDYIRGHSADISSSGGVVAFLLDLLLLGPLLVPLWLVGWWELLHARALRPLGVAALVTFALLLPNGKAYYVGPLFPLVLAAAAVAADRFATQRSRRWPVRLVVGLLVADALLPLPIGIPVLPQSVIVNWHLDSVRKDFSDSIGWPEVAAEVAGAWRRLPLSERRHAVILARYYAEAGAVDRFGPALALPEALSPHLTYWYWKPATTDAQTAIVVGYTATEMRRLFRDVVQTATLSNAEGVHNEAWGLPVLTCRQPRESLDAAWLSLRHFG